MTDLCFSWKYRKGLAIQPFEPWEKFLVLRISALPYHVYWTPE